MKEKDSPANRESEWVRRNIVDEPRLSELVEMYESLGYEVVLKDLNPEEFPDECSECMVAFPERYKIIFTRKKED